ncbi:MULTISPECIES: DNA cytosine methyltransferase [Planomicrobium]|uniref:DNA cytosine methyltransferase n=1 Tax=Planomicrobium TaxID=162291 RepID=UPI000C7CCF82|nr:MULTISPECIES: DNA cytosine methyltransferase [Planomicrobium]PKH10675.1 DNA (cytosine-5-)-methyltransferase [Planomicrobium sp. MB-3u-38]
MNVIDLFAGAGGLSEGFRQAGYNIISHIEMDKSACNTLRTREVYYHLRKTGNLQPYEDYLMKRISREQLYSIIPANIFDKVIETEIGDETFPKITSKIDEQLASQGESEIDIVIGGPPCQAFSTAGISRDPNRMRNDPRNFLYKQYIRFIIRYIPKMFIFENVKGIIKAQQGSILEGLRQELREAGYKIEYRVLNARDFNVSQNRQRVVLIGWREEFNLSYPDFEHISNGVSIRDLFNDLPHLNSGQSIDGKRSYRRNARIANPFIRERGWNILTQHISRPHNENDLLIYRLVVGNWDQRQYLLKYNELPEENQTHNNRKIFLDRYKLVPYDGISHTVVAHISKDGHYYIHPDIQQNRSITVREAARIQSFPDDFYFEDSRTAAFRQIGNAVPPLMAFHIARQLKPILEELN